MVVDENGTTDWRTIRAALTDYHALGRVGDLNRPQQGGGGDRRWMCARCAGLIERGEEIEMIDGEVLHVSCVARGASPEVAICNSQLGDDLLSGSWFMEVGLE